MKRIHRTYKDAEIASIAVNVKCPYCGRKWQEFDPECGKIYILKCDDEFDNGCGKEFEMYFDAD